MRVNQAPLCAAALHLARDDISIAQTAALGPREKGPRGIHVAQTAESARHKIYIV